MIRKILIVASASTLLVFMAMAVLAPWIAPRPYDAIHLASRLEPPSTQHWMGTDELGRDILSRLLYGGRISFFVSAIVVTISLVVGTISGAISGYTGNWLDQLLMRGTDVLLAFPGILLAIALMALLGPSIGNVILALISIGWISYARLARSLTLKLRELDFISASRSIGASWARILRVHVIPNLMPSLVVQASFGFAGAVLAESSLSFLGLGVQPPFPSWGSMLSEGKNHLLDAPHLTLFPGAAIFLSVLSCNLLGDALRDRMDSRLRGTIS